MLDLGTLKIGIKVEDGEARSKLSELDNKTKEAGKSSGSLSDSFEKVGNSASEAGKKLTLGVTTPLVGLAAAAGKVGMDFESSMSKVESLIQNSSENITEDMAKLEATAKEMGATTKFSASEAGDAMTYMGMAGWEAEQMIDGLPGILNLAAADGLDLATTTDIVTDAMTAFGLKANQSGEFADVLAAAASNANTNVAMLGESFKYAAPVAGAFGYSAEDTAIALGLMANAGIKAGMAGTSMRQILTNLTGTLDLTVQGSKGWIVECENMDGSMRPLRDQLIDLREAFGEMTEAEMAANAETIAGKTGMSGLLAVVTAADEDFNKLADAIDNSSGTAEAMAATLQNNVKGQLTILGSSLEGLGIAFYENFKEPLQAIIEKCAEFVSSLIPVVEENAELIATIFGVAAAIGPTLTIIGKLITVVGAILNPVGLVITALGAFAASVTTLYLTNEDFAKEMDKIWNNIQSLFSSVLGKIKGLIEAFTSFTKDMWDRYGEDIIDIIQSLFKVLESIFSTAFNILGGLIDFFAAMFKGDFEGMKEATINICNSMWEGIKDLFKTGITWLGNLIPTMLEIGSNLIHGMWNGIRTVWDGMTSWISGKCSDMLNSVKDFFQIKSPSRVMMQVGKNIGEGMQIGIEDSGKGVLSATKQLANEVLELARYYTLEYENTMSEGQQKVYESRKEAVKNYIADQKYFNDLSLQEEKEFYQGMYELAKGNGEEMIYWEKEIYRVKQEMRKQDVEDLKESNKKYRDLYMQQVTDANNILSAESSEEIKKLQDELDKMDSEDKENAYNEKYNRYQEQIKKLEAELAAAEWDEREKLQKEIAYKQKEFDTWLYEEDRKKQREELSAQIKAEQEALKQKLDNNNKYAEKHLNIVDEKLKKTIELIETGDSKEVASQKAKQQVVSEMNNELLNQTKQVLADKEAAQTESNQNTLSETNNFANDFYTENYRIGVALANGIADGILNTKWRVSKALSMMVNEIKDTFNSVGVDYSGHSISGFGSLDTNTKRSMGGVSGTTSSNTGTVERLLQSLNDKLDRLPRNLVNEERLVRG
ncbi:MAG: phage tail tape measure protein [Sarcina sp.]